jgi:cytochrome c553
MKRGLLVFGLIICFATGTAQAADAAKGKTKAANCAGCHGANGEGAGSNPKLAGMSTDAFVQAMEDYKSGKRPNAMMKALATPFSKADNEDMAAYYASLKK